MKSRSLCSQRKMAQRHTLEHSSYTPASRISGADWMYLDGEGCVAIDRGADRDVSMFALGPGDAPSFG